MKRLCLLIVFIPYLSYSQNVERIYSLYFSAISAWEQSSKIAMPYFDSLYYDVQPLYNKYYTNQYVLNGEIHKIARNYIRFMYEYKIKGFGGKDYINKGWNMSQSMKGYEALRDYNSLQLAKLNRQDINDMILETDVFNYTALRNLNQSVNKEANVSLFLETPTIEDVQRELLPDELYLSFSFSLNDRSFFIVSITKNNYNVYKSTMTTLELFNRIAIIKGLIENDEYLSTVGKINLTIKEKSNFETINDNVKAIEKEINNAIKNYNFKKLIVENDIIISQLPIDVLSTSKQTKFFKEYQISYVPNAVYFIDNKRMIQNKTKNIIGVYPNIRDEEGNPISNEIKERIKNYITDTEIYANCTKATFLDLLKNKKDYDIFHISSHYYKDYSESSYENISISGTEYYLNQLSFHQGYFSFPPDRISPKEIFFNNQVSVNTLILSGCETATSENFLSVIYPAGFSINTDKTEIDENEIRLNLQYTYLLNGGCYCNSTLSSNNLILMSLTFTPKYVIAFQNKIDPEYSDNFFNEFYYRYSQGKSVEESFYSAKRDLLELWEDNDEIYYSYASIILIGN